MSVQDYSEVSHFHSDVPDREGLQFSGCLSAASDIHSDVRDAQTLGCVTQCLCQSELPHMHSDVHVQERFGVYSMLLLIDPYSRIHHPTVYCVYVLKEFLVGLAYQVLLVL
jgi:hypothetical protein